MANKWLAHIKKTMKQMKAKGTYVAGKGLGQVIKAAQKTWHHAKKAVGLKGGAEGDEDGEMKTVPLDDDSEDEEAKKSSASSSGSSGMEVDGEKVTGGRHRKTRRRRRRHSRRRQKK